MNIIVKSLVFFSVLAITLGACSNPAKPAIMPRPQIPATTPEATTTSPFLPSATEKKPATASARTNPPASPATPQANRVEVVYFHMPQRCAACLCFEERIAYVVKTYFQNELASGKLTFIICELGDAKKAALIRKYDAYASQLFITKVHDGVEHSENILGIWKWRCASDGGEFDDKVRNLIEQRLGEIK